MTEPQLIGWLEGLTDNVKGKRLELRGDSFLIGRGSKADIQLEDPQTSREHARLTYADGKLTLEDLGSTQGTYVNGDAIKTTVLKQGDRLRFGGSLFHLHVAKGVLAEVGARQDEIATAMEPEDAVATQLASEDDLGTVLSSDRREVGERQDATVRAEPGIPPAAVPPSPLKTPAVAPPGSPQSAAGTERNRLPRWLIAVLAATVTVVVLGAGLVLAINLLGGEGEAEIQPQVENTPLAAAVEDRASATMEQNQSEAAETTQAVPQGDAQVAVTAEAVATETATQPPPSPEATDSSSVSAALGASSGIAYASDRTGFPQIFYLDLASRVETQLTDIPNGACQPAWSPDGTRLAFTSPCGSNRETYSGSAIFIMPVDVDGHPGEAQPLMISLGGGDYDPDWSPDGSRIAFTSLRTGRPQVFTVGLDGSNVLNVNDDLAHNWSPSWSGDGSQIAFLTGRGGSEEIWLVPADGGEETRFTRGDGKDVAKPDWSPDGNTILLEKVVGSIPRIAAAPVVDGGVRVFQVCQEGPLALQPMSEPAWSPDGTWLAFETWPGGGDHKIAIMQASCTAYEELTDDPALEFDAAWRPSS